MTFDETGEFIQAPPGTGLIAVTRIHSDPETGKITDADIVFNGRDFTFGDGAEPGAVELRDVAVHEIGHLLGLDHTPLEGPLAIRPTMNPFYDDGGPGEGFTLEADDIAGVSMMYPAPTFALSTGRIAGRITDVEDTPVFGALVSAENQSSGESYATLSGAFPELGSRSQPRRGEFLLAGLLPGGYRLQIAPLSGRIDEDNFSGIFFGLDIGFPREYYDNFDREDFATTLSVVAGEELAGVEITTGFRRQGYSFMRPFAELANTPGRGPYKVRARGENVAAAALSVRIGEVESTAADPVLRLPMRARGTLSEAEIPGQKPGSRIHYQLESVSPEGETAVYPGRDAWLHFDVVHLTGAPLLFFTALRPRNVVSVFDTGSAREVARIHQVGVADEPLDLALSPDGSRLYVTNSGAGTVSAIKTATLEASEIRLGNSAVPYGVAALEDVVAITDLRHDRVLVIDGAGALLHSVPVAGQPRSTALSPDTPVST